MIASAHAAVTTNQIPTLQSTVVKKTAVILVMLVNASTRLLINCWLIVVAKEFRSCCLNLSTAK